MKKLTKRIALLLISVMVLGSMAGCSKKSNDVDTTTDNTPTPTTATTDNSGGTTDNGNTDNSGDVVAGIDGYTAFADNVTLKVPVYDRGVEGVPSVSSNYWTQWIQENFGDTYNVTVEFVPITRSDVMTDYALMASGGDLPTILMEYDYPKHAQWANDGYLTTFDMEEFAQVAPTYYNRMAENNQLPYTEMNGETYFALALRPYYDTNYAYQQFVRMDWLRAVGYDYVPVLREEIVDAMTKIQEAGLAENPLGGSMITGVGSDQNYMYRDFPFDEELWAQVGNVNIPSLGTDADYKLLKRANEDYNLGFTNPEYYITDAETNKAQFINGEVYSFGAYISANMDWLNSFYAQNPDAELAVKPMPVSDEAGGTTSVYRNNNPFGMIVGFSSTATADEIKAAWMYMEWMTQEDVLFTMQWGIEGEHYTVDATTGLPVSVGEYNGDKTQGYNNSKDYWCITNEARIAGTIEDLIAASSPKGLPQDFTQDILDVYYQQKELSDQGYGVLDIIFSVNIDAETDYSGALVEKYKEFRDKLTMCSPEEFDALYEKYTKEYQEAGYQEIMDERLEAFKNGYSTKLFDNQKAQ